MTSRLAFLFILTTLVIDAMGIGLILPVTPDLIRELTGEGIDGAADWGGFLAFTYAAMQVLCGPLVGNLSDRFGRRPVLTLSLLCMGIDYLVMGFAETLWLLFLARAISGIAGATYSTAYAFVADISDPDDRAARFGMLGAAFGVGFILGPLIGGVLGEFGPRAPFFAAGALALANAAFGFFVLPETLKSPRALDWHRANPLNAVRRIAALPHIGGMVAVFFLYAVAHSVYPVIWSYYAIAQFDWSPFMVGVSLASFGICIAVIQGGMIRPILRRFGERRTALYGFVINIAMMCLLPFIGSGWLLLALSPVTAAGVIVTPAMQGLMSRRVADDAQGELQGVISAAQGIASILSPVAMTQVFRYFTAEGTPVYLPGAPFLLAAALMAVALALHARTGREPASA